MAITESVAERESTKREMIEQRLLGAVELARANSQAIMRLRTTFLGASEDTQQADHPAHPGWLGEIQDGLEEINHHMGTTAKALQDIQAQVAQPVPTSTKLGITR